MALRSWGERLADHLLRRAGLAPRLLPALAEMTPVERAIYGLGWEAARATYAPRMERAERLLADRLQHAVAPWVREARAALRQPDPDIADLRRRVVALEAESGRHGLGDRGA